MMGLAGSITPTTTGKVLILISGDIANSSNNLGAQVRIRFGTGTAPANGAALTGTSAGGLQKDSSGNGANTKVPFSVNAVVTGLTTGTTYWIDLELNNGGGGTASVFDISISALEL